MYKTEPEPPESISPPEFITPIKAQKNIQEGGFAHFDARLEPLNDSSLKVEWLKDGKPVEASECSTRFRGDIILTFRYNIDSVINGLSVSFPGSRITTFFNFGYVALSIKSVTVHDAGIYTCRAYNNLGEASTSNELSVISKENVIYDSQHPEGLQQIQRLEDSRLVLIHW